MGVGDEVTERERKERDRREGVRSTTARQDAERRACRLSADSQFSRRGWLNSLNGQ